MDIDECREKVAQMSKSIFQYCLSRTSSYQESEDLSQEILLTLCDSIANLRDEKAFYALASRIFGRSSEVKRNLRLSSAPSWICL